MARWGYAAAPSDGTRLFYEDDDRGDPRPPVILCDGIGCDGYVWRYLRPSLAPRRVVHAHYRGHGRSQAPRTPSRIEIEDLADDAVAVLDDADIASAVFIGHSMGVQVALEAWRRHRDRVAGLVLVCGAPSHPLRSFRGSAALEEMLPAIERWVLRVPGMVNGLTRRLLPTRFALEIAGRFEINRLLVNPDDFMPYLEGMARMDIRTFLAMLAAAGRHTTDAVLQDVDVPTLVVAGGRDGFTPPDRSREVADRVPGAEWLEIEDGSHTAPIERPERINEVIITFLERHAR